METIEQCEARAIRVLTKAATAEGAARTSLLRDAADALLCIRERVTGPDGEPDWRGRTIEYRATISEIFKASGVARDTALKSTLRYHTNNLLRDRLTDADLDRLGLLPVSARERASESYHRLASDAARGRMTNEPASLSDLDVLLRAVRMCLRVLPPEPRPSARRRTRALDTAADLIEWADSEPEDPPA